MVNIIIYIIIICIKNYFFINIIKIFLIAYSILSNEESKRNYDTYGEMLKVYFLQIL